MRQVLRVIAGSLLGLIAGVSLTLAIVVARAQLGSVYLHSINGVVGWLGLPVILGPLAGIWLAIRAGSSLSGAVIGACVGALVGIMAGVVVGALLGDHPSLRWAGGIIGNAVGVGFGAALGAWWGGAKPRRSASPGREGAVGGVALAPLAMLVVAACAERPQLPPASRLPEPSPADVESVIIFTGDIGLSREIYHPIVPRIRGEVERWAGRLERDSAVVVVLLGDLIYPEGLHPRGHELYARDSLRLASQIGTVAGPAARENGARAYFVPGNHDWGRKEGTAGAVRVKRMEEFIESWNVPGVTVHFEPEAGTGGPASVDIGEHLRLILLDTAWWLLEGERSKKDSVVAGIGRAMRERGERRVVVAAHHPFESAGPHGGYREFGEGLGIGYLLARSGALLQDLNSVPYRELRRALLDLFRSTGPPALFAGGHEHSLQIVRSEEANAPEISLVSGSATKLSGVADMRGLLFARSAPGYARLFVKKDGSLELFIEAAPARFLECPRSDPERGRCMEAGVRAYGTVWAGRL